MSTEANITEAHNTDEHKNIVVRKSMALWKKFMLYPAVFAALFGAVPTVMDIYNAWKYNIRYSNVRHAEEQRALWEKNFACTSDLLYQKVRTDQDVEVQVGACNNGDVLITVEQPDGKKVVEWVALKNLSQTSAGSLFSNAAFATPFSPKKVKTGYFNQRNIHQATNKVETICQEMIKAEAKIFRIIKDNNVCYTETVSMMKGTVSKRKEVPCETQCKAYLAKQVKK